MSVDERVAAWVEHIKTETRAGRLEWEHKSGGIADVWWNQYETVLIVGGETFRVVCDVDDHGLRVVRSDRVEVLRLSQQEAHAVIAEILGVGQSRDLLLGAAHPLQTRAVHGLSGSMEVSHDDGKLRIYVGDPYYESAWVNRHQAVELIGVLRAFIESPESMAEAGGAK